MIYIKQNGNDVVLAGQVADQRMLDAGFIQYDGVIPVIEEYQIYNYDGTVLTVVNDDENYTKAVSDKIQIMLDDKAIEFRYDTMLSARSMAGIPLTGSDTTTEIALHDEAISLAQWYLSCWAKATDIEEDVINLVIPRPTVEEVIDQMPAYV